MTKFKIVAVSDTVCPWCYVGKQKLDRAIRTYKELHPGSTDEFSTTWMPFYLNPDSPKTGTYRLQAPSIICPEHSFFGHISSSRGLTRRA
jgi:predicted DsbA family dithiol-disulfide isomerase